VIVLNEVSGYTQIFKLARMICLCEKAPLVAKILGLRIKTPAWSVSIFSNIEFENLLPANVTGSLRIYFDLLMYRRCRWVFW